MTSRDERALAQGVRLLHWGAHRPTDADAPGVLVQLEGPESCLVILGLLLVMGRFPCLGGETAVLCDRLYELIDTQIFDGEMDSYELDDFFGPGDEADE